MLRNVLIIIKSVYIKPHNVFKNHKMSNIKKNTICYVKINILLNHGSSNKSTIDILDQGKRKIERKMKGSGQSSKTF